MKLIDGIEWVLFPVAKATVEITKQAVRGMACTLGFFGYPIVWLSASGELKPLSARVKYVMEYFFPDLDLDSVQIATDASAAIPGDKDAVTLNTSIYIMGAFDECDKENMRLLMHELVHVRQYMNKGWARFSCDYALQFLASGGSYEDIPMEQKARKFADDNHDAMVARMKDVCAKVTGPIQVSQPANWFWITWGGA
jgi:hypothetical protein